MGNSELVSETDGSEAAYKIVTHAGHAIPDSYRPLFFSKFLRSLRNGNQYFAIADSDAYYFVYHQFIEQLIRRPGVTVHFAVLADEPDIVLGWSLKQGLTLHYVFVNSEQRGQGIGKALCGEFNTVTHMTKIGAKLIKKFPDVKVNYWG